MKTEIDHLPAKQQGELERIKRVLMEEFGRSIERSTKPEKRNGKVLKIILFGSYCRDDWVDEPENGYKSDFDLLIVVNHESLTDISQHWYIAEDKILQDSSIDRTLNIIVHTLDEVNRSLSRGEYFWVDIIREGIALYELPNHPLTTPKPLTMVDAYLLATEYYKKNSASAANWLRMAELATKVEADQDWLNKIAFNLHQAVETLYACFLLTTTHYFPRSHNIKFLRSLAESKNSLLIEAWTRDNKADRRRFELLKRAYVESRYSSNYEISVEDLRSLASSATNLRDIVEEVCSSRLEKLQADAGI